MTNRIWRKASFSTPEANCVEVSDPRWRKSTFSGAESNCVEVAAGLGDEDRIAVRNSNNPEAGTLSFTRAEMAAWINGCKAGEFDDLL
jgi:hypothetical protein